MEQKYLEFYRGEIYYADMNTVFSQRMTSLQPVLVLLTDQGLYSCPTVLVAEARHTAHKPSQATHVMVEDAGGLPGNVVFRLEKPYPIDKRRLRGRAGKLTPRQMEEVDAALRSHYNLEDGGCIPMEVEAP